jgi:hypothetical protein
MIGAQAYYRNRGFVLSSDRSSGRRAFCTRVEAKGGNHGGAYRSENASTSNHKRGKTPRRRKTKVFFAMVISEELVGPKPIPNGGGDGHTVNIP